MPDDEYLDGVRSSTNQYRKWIDQALKRFGARSFFAHHGLSPDGFVLLVGEQGRHPFADTHPFCNLAAIDPRFLGADAPSSAVDFVVLTKYFRCLYDWQRWQRREGGLGGRKGVFDDGVAAWLGQELELGISFESVRARARFVEERWKEFGFPLDLVNRTWEPERWIDLFHECRTEFQEAVLGMFNAVDSMGREIQTWAAARGIPFEAFWRSCFEKQAAHGSSEAPKLMTQPEFMWVPCDARITEVGHLEHWYHMAVFAVADMFLRRMVRKERPIGSGRAGLCAYLAAGALGADLVAFRDVFGGDSVSYENALILKKRFGYGFDDVLEMVLDGKMAFELFEMTAEAPRTLM